MIYLSLKLHLLIVFIISWALLFYEISLIRIFSIVQWYDFAYFAISLALMGFGISGSFVYLFQTAIQKNIKKFIFVFVTLFFISLPLFFFLYLQVPFNALLVGLDNNQILYFILNTVFMLIPFFFGATVIIISMMHFQVNKIYFANLCGSGLGVISCYIIMHFVHPFRIIFIILGILSISIILSALAFKKKFLIYSALIIIFVISATYYFIEYHNIFKIAEYKSYSLVKNMPDFNIIAESYSPQSLITVARARGLRRAGDLSYNFYGYIPEIYGMFFDYDNLSPVYRWDGDMDSLTELEFLHRNPNGLGHYLLKDREKRTSLVLGTGGGSGLLRGIKSNFKKITGIEYNKRVIELMQSELSDWSGNIYSIDNIKIHNIDARNYIETTDNSYQLIELEMLDSFVSSSSGIASLREDYLYTIESFSRLWKIMDNDGIISISRWIQNPPRDSLKIVNTIFDTLKAKGIKNPKDHIIAIRGPMSINILLTREAVCEERIQLTRSFCEKNGFDLVYYSNIKEEETNIYFMEKDSNLFRYFSILLDDSKRDKFIEDYLFDIQTTTDNKPYFFNFFRYPVIDNIIRETGTQELEFSQWGYFSILIMLIPTAFITLICIFLPLLIRKKKIRINRFSISSLLFFFCIGIAFFFIEIILIQKLILFLGHPVSSISIVIASVLTFSGLGSYFSGKLFPDRLPIIPLLSIIVLIIIIFGFMDIIFMNFIQLPYFSKAIISIILIFPLSFFMGMPLPLTLNHIKKTSQDLVPWCWGINGFASVNSIFLCSVFSLIFGFNTVVIFAIIAYSLAFCISLILKRS